VHRFVLPRGELVALPHGRVTTVERAAVDALAGMEQHAADSLLVWLLTRGVISRQELADRVAAHPGAWGNVQLRRLLDETRTGALSVAERRLHRILDRACLSGWQANVAVWDADGVIGAADVLFAIERVIIEVDGRAAHGPDQFQADRERNNRLLLAGYQVLHFTWHDLTRRPAEVVRQIRTALGR
jgi:very-short-patch-repair endonuclease